MILCLGYKLGLGCWFIAVIQYVNHVTKQVPDQEIHSRKATKKEILFCTQTDLPSRIGWSGHLFLIFFSFLVAKMTPLGKNTKSPPKTSDFGKIFSVIFQKFLAKFSLTLAKNGRFYGFSKLKKISEYN